MKTHSLKATFADWSDERARYPGWLILPWRNRERFSPGKHDLCEVLDAIEKLAPKNRVPMLEQLVWRCELSLNLPEWYEDTILPQVLRETVEFVVTSLNEIESSYHEAALRLVVTQLRQDRISGNDTRFISHSDFLTRQELPARFPDLANALQYQIGQHAAICCDNEKLNDIINHWPSGGDIYWQVRRAGLMIEAGQIEEACVVLENFITTIRARPNVMENEIFLRSREAFARYVHSVAINAKNWLSRRREDITELEWDQFNLVRSNPHDEFVYYETRLAVAPIWRQGTIERRTFDPGKITSSVSSSGDHVIEKLDAREWLLFCEDFGLSPIFLRRAQEIEERVFSRMAYSAPLGAIRLLVQFQLAEKLGDSALMRCRVAGLTDEDVAATWRWGRNTLFKLLENVKRASNPNRAIEKACDAAITLSYVYCRLNSEQIRDELESLEILHHSEVVRLNGRFHNAHRKLWERIIAVLPEELLIERLPDWLAYPVPNDAGFKVDHFTVPGWPDPSEIALRQESHRLAGKINQIAAPSKLTLTRLIDRLGKDQDVCQRKCVCLRVGLSHLRKILPNGLQRRFSKGLWSQIGSDGLPSNTGFLPMFLLSLPSRKETDVISHLRSLATAKVSEPVPGVISDDHFETLNQLSKGESDSDTGLIKWTDNELSKILEKISLWSRCLGEGHELNENEFWGRPTRTRTNAIANFLLTNSRLIVRKNKLLTPELENLLSAFYSKSLHPYVALSQAILFPKVAKQSESRICDALISGSEQEFSAYAVAAFYRWISWGSGQQPYVPITALSESTIRRISTLARLHHQPHLKGLLELLGTVVSQAPMKKALRIEVTNDAIMTLSSLASKANYEIEPWSKPGQFDPSKIPAIRQGIASLAYELDAAGVVDPVVKYWREQTQNDPLPEIRRAASRSL